ncbi:GntR family transcriptional regulator [Jiangella mangrovi]|uniref:DNA-binding GntR family transcriptional regulator n=1 Tax=Jiangella mangrovi TaxID=1524084 RepID=A0A7W9LMM1_9ACTN|nr:GntR family transcriptional regulator [Jiangella mangrovi]MBB5789329.1 DNA-binding GntR family transcriptional regulator [Jiangella mangrovi]
MDASAALTAPADWMGELAVDRAALGRSSTAQRVAEILRARITEGLLPPGTRLSEDAIGTALGVSRNTLREAFRLLLHERLATHELGRGVFVRVLDATDVADLYRVRRLLESAALRNAPHAPPGAMARLEAALAEGAAAAAEERWRDVGTANMHVHQAIAGLAGSPRIDDIMRQLLAELRLAFHIMDAPKTFHAPYQKRHGQIADLLRAGQIELAERALDEYLNDAERQLIEAFAQLEAVQAGR